MQCHTHIRKVKIEVKRVIFSIYLESYNTWIRGWFNLIYIVYMSATYKFSFQCIKVKPLESVSRKATGQAGCLPACRPHPCLVI